MSRALEMAFEQVKAGKSKHQIASEIGYSRPAVSRFMSGTYGAGLAKIEAAIYHAYDRRDCLHTGEAIAPEVCRKKASAPKPFGGTARLTWWEACQGCCHNPIQEGYAK